MTDELLRLLRPVLRDEKRAEQILERYWTKRIALVWTVTDVHTAANERDRALSDSEAVELLRLMHKGHNKQYGLQWKDFTRYIEEYQPGRKMNSKEIRQFVKHNRLTIRR